jgi:hypothetical protein
MKGDAVKGKAWRSGQSEQLPGSRAAGKPVGEPSCSSCGFGPEVP